MATLRQRSALLVAVVGAALGGASWATAPQDAPQQGDPPSATSPQAVATSALVPGRLPPQATPAAVERWNGLLDALCGGNRRELRVESFRIRFDLRARSGLQSNDLRVAARFLAPGFLAFTDPRGRELGLGPEGPWLVERDGTVLSLIGREYQSDLDNLRQNLALARNYLALCDPDRIRLAELRAMDGAPPVLPEVDGVRPATLRWLELVTPDFGVVPIEPRESEGSGTRRRPPPRAGSESQAPSTEADPGAGAEPILPAEALYRVWIGVDRQQSTPVLVTIRPAASTAPERLVEHCIHLRDLKVDGRGRAIPWRLDVYQRWPALPELAQFAAAPAQEIDLLEAQLAPRGLTAEDFSPRPK
jgi:hypothetical protein